ncbi:DUF397 domain-containing protein [Nocardia gipuzkoensis]|uniref:DUF397 domain-containing protein n=1 Tax=Nocardia TaxID=1817 RepID=UPI001892F419|nr:MULTISPECIES: DUF397 domain-containing protein [Nocardia]MBF6221346.1 DUF397 domain-containing protein [Nocardia abscessus]MDE1671424.1 DUF397 domain-containing protein [Nocardia gipuzkoensis]
MTIDLAGAQWFKSAHSGTGNECVEVAWLEAGHVGVRDSKNPSGPALIFSPGQWDAFAIGLRDGEFNWPAS